MLKKLVANSWPRPLQVLAVWTFPVICELNGAFQHNPILCLNSSELASVAYNQRTPTKSSFSSRRCVSSWGFNGEKKTSLWIFWIRPKFSHSFFNISFGVPTMCALLGSSSEQVNEASFLTDCDSNGEEKHYTSNYYITWKCSERGSSECNPSTSKEDQMVSAQGLERSCPRWAWMVKAVVKK